MAADAIVDIETLPKKGSALLCISDKAHFAIRVRRTAGEVTLVEAKKLSVLPAPARKIAIAAIEDGKDVRTAIREAKKEDYNASVRRDGFGRATD